MMAQSLQPGQPRPQENAWPNTAPSDPLAHVDAESFPSLNTPRKEVSAKALQDETFGKEDADGGLGLGPGLAKRQPRRKSRRNDQPRRDIKRANGVGEENGSQILTDSGVGSFDFARSERDDWILPAGMPSEVIIEQPMAGIDDMEMHNGHLPLDDPIPPAKGSQNSRFEHAFDDYNDSRSNGHQRRDGGGYHRNEFRRNNNNNRGRRRFTRYNDHHKDDRMNGPSGSNSPRSGSQEMDESSRRHRYSHRRRDDNRHGGYDRNRSYRSDGDRFQNRRRNDFHGNNNGRRWVGRTRMHDDNVDSSGRMNDFAPQTGQFGPRTDWQQPPSYGGQNADVSGFGPNSFQVNQVNPVNPTPTYPAGYPVLQYPHQVFPYPQVPFPANPAVLPHVYPGLPGQSLVMFQPNLPASFGYPGVMNGGLAPGVADANLDGVIGPNFETEQAMDQIGKEMGTGVMSQADQQGEVSDMNKLSDAAAESPRGDSDQQSADETGGLSTPSDQISAQPVPVLDTSALMNFDPMQNAYPPEVQSVMVPQMFGVPPMWPGAYGPMVVVPPGSSDPAYNAHIKEQSSQVAVTDTGTHFPAHGDELEIPRGPYFCVKVACVATGNRHDDRDVGQVVVVDFDCQVRCNIYVKSDKKIVSYLDPLTSLAPGTWIEQYGLPLSEAERIVKETVPKNAVIVGQNVFQDMQWLNMKKDKDYRESIDLRDLWHVWNTQYNSFTHFSLEHQAKCILSHPPIPKHNSPLDANLTMQLFTAYMEARAQKSGTKLQDMRALLQQYRQDQSFSRRNGVFEGVCMGNRRSCKCGAPALHTQGTPFLMVGRRTTHSADGTPIGSPRTPRAPLTVSGPGKAGGEAPSPASAPSAGATIFEPPVVTEEQNGLEDEVIIGNAETEVETSLHVLQASR